MRESEEHERIEPGPTPWPVRAGAIWKTLYGHSLAIAFGAGDPEHLAAAGQIATIQALAAPHSQTGV